MFQPIKALFISITIISFSYADVFITELTDPQNSSDAGRYVELYNNGNDDIDLSSGWALQRWTNGNVDPQSPKPLTGSIAAGGFFIICNDADKFNGFYGLTCDQDIGTGGAADSNGDDNIALLDASGAIVDMFGVPGEDGSGTGHEFEDGRAERADSNTSASATWDEAGWNIDNDSGGGDGNQYAPEGFDPAEWIGALPTADVEGCMDESATNYDPSATVQNYNEYGTSLCTYASCDDIPTATGCLWVDGTSSEWWEGWWNCDGATVCGLAEVIFELDLSDDISGTPHVNGTYNGWCGSCFNDMSDDDGDGIWTHTQYFSPGEFHEYKFTVNGWDNQEDLAGLECALETDGNWNRTFTTGDANSTQTLSNCWGSCESDCSENGAPGCIDDCADFDAINNYFENGEGDFTPDQICTTLSSWGSDSCLDDCDTVAYPEDGYCGGDLPDDECDSYSEETCTATDGCEWLVTSEYEEIMMIVTACTDCLDAGNCNELFEDDEDDPSEYTVTFDIDGVEDCGFVSVTGSFDGWSGWGAHTDSSMTVSGLTDGDYEYTILCVDTSIDEWYNDIWGASTQYTAPSECDFVPGDEYSNYGFTVDGSDTTVSICAGSCDATCPINYNVTFNVNMNFQDVDEENGVRLFGLSSWSSSDAITMTDEDGDGVYSTTVSLTAGSYEFKYRNGWSYEDVDELECAVKTGDYWNRGLTVSDSDMSLDTNCFGVCSDCVGGCMDTNATNYNSDANTDDGSCEYPQVEAANLFFSEYAEGSSNNKYLEIYNASDDSVDLSGYSLSSCSNGCDEHGVWDYADNVTFEIGTTVSAGDVYVVCHGSADDVILAECDQTFTYLSNGDDVFGLTQIGTGDVLDIIGTTGDDPGSGWEVAGEANATKDHTLVRDGSVSSGNDGNWEASAGDADNSEWIVLDQNTWAFIGSHPHDFASTCDDDTACNFGSEGDCTYSEEGFNCDGQALINVTFHVNMSEQQVDTVGYGLSLFLDGFSDMLDEDGDGIWSQTLTLVANTTYSYKFKNGDDWEVNFNDLGCGDGDTYGNRTFTSGDADMDLGPFCFNSCEDCVVPCNPGDVNSDDSIDVLDIVSIVDHIVYGTEIDCADVTGDGTINVLDIVALVDSITGGRSNNATSAAILLDNHTLSISADGYIGGVQMTLSHGNDFSIDLTDDALVAEYNTSDNQTTLVVVVPGSDELFSYSGDFEIVDMIVANSSDRINTSIVRGFSLSDAYPNPFNPTTSMTLAIPEAGNVSVQVYNIMGQVVATLASGYMDANTYTLTWDASDVSSGMYFVKAESAGTVTTQKLVLMK